MLADRIKQAVEVLGSDQGVDGTMREQAAAHLGEDVDNRALEYMSRSAIAIFEQTHEAGMANGFSESDADFAAVTMVLIAGAAIGKRLGIEDGEKFAKEIPSVD